MEIMSKTVPINSYLRMPRIHELRPYLENVSVKIQDNRLTEKICNNCKCSSNYPLFLFKINGIINTNEYLCETCCIDLLANETVDQVLKDICYNYTEYKIIHQLKNEDKQLLQSTDESIDSKFSWSYNNNNLLEKIFPKSSSVEFNEEEIEPKVCNYNFVRNNKDVIKVKNDEHVELSLNDFKSNIESHIEIEMVEPNICNSDFVKENNRAEKVQNDEHDEISLNCFKSNIESHVGIEIVEFPLHELKSVTFSDTEQAYDTTDSATNKEIDIFHYGVTLSEFYTDEMRIGSGKFGKVFRVTHKETKQYFAAKTIIYRNQKCRDDIINEIEILRCLYGNEHVMQLIEVIDNNKSKPKTLHLITEYLEGGELFDQIANDELLTEMQVIGIMCQILDGVAFIHDRGIIHRDLKPENIVYLSKANDLLKIIDFGFAVKFDDKKPPKSMVGTTIFVAPEVLRFECQSYLTDMWSVGVITYNLLAGITPFEIPLTGDPMRNLSDHEIMENIEKCQYDFNDEGFIGVSNEAKDFISSLLIREPKKRLSAKDCLKHDWLSSSCKQNKETNLSRSISLQRMKNYVAVQKWQKLGLVIKSVNTFKNAVIS